MNCRAIASLGHGRNNGSTLQAALEQLERRTLLAVVQPLDIGQFRGRPGQFGHVNAITLFTTTDQHTGQKLWGTDGNAVGTVLIKDLEVQVADPSAWFISGRDNVLTVGNTFYFTGVDNAHGRELWRSDGTATGTRLVKDLVPGADDSNPEGFVALNGQLIFSADRKIWRSDGTAEGTVMIKDADPLGSGLPERMAALGDHVFFMVYPSQSPYHGTYNTGELWRTDGTAGGTVMIRDLSLGVDPTNVNESRSGLINVAGTLFFSANDGVHGWELWRSDGTKKGTVLVRDLAPPDPNPFIDGSYPSNLTDVNGTLHFSADGFLYKTDGTASGTIKLKTVTSPRGFVAINGLLFFSSGDSLWKSDGTQAGTVQVADIEPAEAFGANGVASLNGRVYFGASSGSGFELYETDGTPARTLLAYDAEPGVASSNAQPLGRYADKVIFTARSDSTALWQLYSLAIPQPYAPKKLGLLALTDSPFSAAVAFTRESRPTFSGLAPADSLVRIFSDGVEVALTLAAKGLFEVAPSDALTDGAHAISATATDELGRSSELSETLNIRVDTAPPRVRFKAISPQVLELKFTENVAASLSVADLALEDIAKDQPPSNAGMRLSYNAAKNTALVTFPQLTGGLPGAKYRFSIDPSGVTDAAGNALAPATSFLFTPPGAPLVGVTRRVLRISGTNSDDQIIIRRKASDPSRLEVSLNDVITTHALSTVQSIRVHGLLGDDLIRFDHANGPLKIHSTLYGEEGSDTINGSATRDRVYGGDGNDEIRGGGGHDILYGEGGQDALFGERGNDYVVGGLDRDIVQGNRGADRLFVDRGVDEVTRDRQDELLT